MIASIAPPGGWRAVSARCSRHGPDSRHPPQVRPDGTVKVLDPFDIDRLAIAGDAVAVVEDLAVSASSSADFGVSDDGTLIYVAGDADGGSRTLVWIDREGREVPLSAPPRGYAYPRISPDGTRVAIDTRDRGNDIWVWDMSRETLTPLTFTEGSAVYPTWTADGQRVVFGSDNFDSGRFRLFWKAADGTGDAELLADGETITPLSSSPDGEHLVFREGAWDVGVLSLQGPGEPASTPLLTGPFNERNAEVSPQGRWLAYESDESGQYEIYVRPFPNVEGGRWQISVNGGTRPLWSRDGRELFFVTLDGRLMSVPVQTDSGFTPGNPSLLLADTHLGPSVGGSPGRNYDVSPDGQRFLMIKEGEGSEDASAAPRIIVVENWHEELRQLVPTE